MKQKGFTLIELLVVIAIIGVLAAIVLINLNASRAQSRDVRRLADIRQLQKALELYYNDCGQYPPALDPTTADGCPSPMTLADFIPTIPLNPAPGGKDYVYNYDGANNTYSIDFALEGQNNDLASGDHTADPTGFH